MFLKIKKVIEVEVITLKVTAGVRYWEDTELNGEPDIDRLIPCRVGQYWKPEIALDTGRIINWEQGKIADVHYKVCDNGSYILFDALGNQVCRKDGYVPEIMCPGGQGYGDYIIMKIDENGVIENWCPIFDDFDFTEGYLSTIPN